MGEFESWLHRERKRLPQDVLVGPRVLSSKLLDLGCCCLNAPGDVAGDRNVGDWGQVLIAL